jgi:DNA/RNA-binding domain of Phe-tRNA-synthetase-like protein
MQFKITDDVRRLGVRGAFAILGNLDNRAAPAGLALYRQELTERLRAELTPDFVESDPILRGFRDLHDAVGRSNRRFPSSAEALVTLFQRKGLVPSISPLVDIYNGISLETRLSLGAHDVAKVTGDIKLRLTNGNERFVALGQAAPEAVNPGEYCYVDGSHEVLCRLEHRQCEKTKLTADTASAFYIIQGNASTPHALLEQALRRLVDLTQRFCGGREEQFWIVD